MGSGEEALALAPEHPGSVRRPMLNNDRLYFISMGLSDDGKKLLVVKGEHEQALMFVVPAAGEFPTDVSKNTVQTAGWRGCAL